uniref:Uncharacterized protein n=1 Tax=Mesocestoides corti TaxID=53468 RepID=A0A5K3F4E7_MESCO
MSAPSYVASVEYPSPSVKKTGTTEQALLTNHEPQSHSKAAHPSPSRWSRRSLYTAPHSWLSLVSCLSSSHALRTQRDRGLAKAGIV